MQILVWLVNFNKCHVVVYSLEKEWKTIKHFWQLVFLKENAVTLLPDREYGLEFSFEELIAHRESSVMFRPAWDRPAVHLLSLCSY